MLRLYRFIANNFTLRLSLMVVCAITVLLMAALFILLSSSRQTVKQEALEKVVQTLDATVIGIDNVLFSAEQASGNIYLTCVATHLDQPDMMLEYSRQLVENCPSIVGCAIAFEPYYYKEKGRSFMAYYHRDYSEGNCSDSSEISRSETFGNRPYTQQEWYAKPLRENRPFWVGPIRDENTEGESLITFSLPIADADGRTVGVMAVDVSLSILSKIVMSSRPSPDSHCTLIAKDGSFIITSDSSKHYLKSVFSQTEYGTDSTVKDVVESMVAGETGFKFVRLRGLDSYVFYKPFKRWDMPGRITEDLGWSVGLVYPKENIFGDYNRLLYSVVGIAVVGLLLLLVFSLLITRRHLKPLLQLTNAAQRISEGHYNDPIPQSHLHDEIGLLQVNFQRMQQSLSVKMGELDKLTHELQQQGEVLGEAYENAKEADNMKTAFLHNMTNQMADPVISIVSSVEALSTDYAHLSEEEINCLVDAIVSQGTTVTELLNQLLDASGNTPNDFVPIVASDDETPD